MKSFCHVISCKFINFAVFHKEISNNNKGVAASLKYTNLINNDTLSLWYTFIGLSFEFNCTVCTMIQVIRSLHYLHLHQTTCMFIVPPWAPTSTLCNVTSNKQHFLNVEDDHFPVSQSDHSARLRLHFILTAHEQWSAAVCCAQI